MIAKPIDKLERQFQDLIEGAFARMFRRATNSRDIGLLLLRALEENARPASERGAKPVAPDTFHIYLHPDDAEQLMARFPDLPGRLAPLIAELSKESGYQLGAAPEVLILADSNLEAHQARVTASHGSKSSAKTEKMAAVPPAEHADRPMPIPHLHIANQDAVPLVKPVINIGRESNNDLVIGDAFVSRHHLQLRKRFGAYTLIDVNSRGGTLVNNTAVNERRLQDGDVIRIGHTDLIYAEDHQLGTSDCTTQILQEG